MLLRVAKCYDATAIDCLMIDRFTPDAVGYEISKIIDAEVEQ